MILINNLENIYYFMNGLILMFLSYDFQSWSSVWIFCDRDGWDSVSISTFDLIWFFSAQKFCPNLLWPRWLGTPSRRRTTQTSSSFTRGKRRGTSRSTSPTNFLWSLCFSRRNEWVEGLTFEMSRVSPAPPKKCHKYGIYVFVVVQDTPNLAQVSFYSFWEWGQM